MDELRAIRAAQVRLYLRRTPLIKRKARLCELVRRSRLSTTAVCTARRGCGERVFQRNLPLRSGRYRGETKDGRVSGGPLGLDKGQEQDVFAGRGKARTADAKGQKRLMARVSARGVCVSGPAPRQRRAQGNALAPNGLAAYNVVNGPAQEYSTPCCSGNLSTQR